MQEWDEIWCAFPIHSWINWRWWIQWWTVQWTNSGIFICYLSLDRRQIQDFKGLASDFGVLIIYAHKNIIYIVYIFNIYWTRKFICHHDVRANGLTTEEDATKLTVRSCMISYVWYQWITESFDGRSRIGRYRKW